MGKRWPMTRSHGNATSRPRSAEVIDHRYRVTAFIGDGGMGSVFRAEHVKLRKPVALKLLHKEYASNPDFCERFEREAMAASRIDHANCVAVSDFGRLPNGSLYLVMELVQGRTLGELLGENVRLPVPRALHIAKHALRALGHAHSVGIVHRDVKPDNIILVDQDGDRDFAKLLDFGIAKLVGDAANEIEDAHLTQVGTTVGTPKYMPPEQAFGKDVDGRADLYSLSVVLYSMLAGRAPFESDDVIDLLMQQASADPPRFAEVASNADIPSEVETLVRKGLEKKRDDRYANADEYLLAIEGAIDAYHAAKLNKAAATVSLGDGGTMAGLGAIAPVPTVASSFGVVSPPSRSPQWWQRFTQKQIAITAGSLVLLIIIIISAASGADEAPIPTNDSKLEAAFDLLEDGAKALSARGPSELAQRAKELNAAGKYREALEASKGPQLDGYARLERGIALVALKRTEEALRSFRQALSETPALRTDEQILRVARGMLGARDARAELVAIEILVRYTSNAEAKSRLLVVAGEGKNLEARQRARALSQELNTLDEVNIVRSYALDLVQEKTCARRRAALLELGKLGDKRALPAIKKARHRMRGGVLGIGEENSNRCLTTDAAQIIETLENE